MIIIILSDSERKLETTVVMSISKLAPDCHVI